MKNTQKFNQAITQKNKKRIDVSIVIPAYNEEHSVEKTTKKLKETLKSVKKSCELIIVNDCSTDATKKILEDLKKTVSTGKKESIKYFTVIHHKQNKGYGAALKTGIRHAQGDWVLITDCDGTYPIETIPELIKESEDYDMVVGSRTGKIVKVPFVRRPAKWVLRKLAGLVAGQPIPDLNSGLRIFKKDIALRFWGLFPERFSFTTTITLACLTNGYDVKFIPINYFRRKGTSSIKPTDFFNFLMLIIRILTYFRPLNMFIPLAGTFILIGIIKAIIDFARQNYFGIGAVMIILVGIQIGLLGLLADLIIKRTTL